MEEKKVIKVRLGTVICVFIIALLVIALVGMWYYYNYIEDNKQTSIQTNVITESKTENLYNYIGKWYISTDNYEGSQYERELTISKIENNKLTFSLFVFRTEVDENIVGTIEDNVVTFSDIITGTMTFDNNTITLKITESENNNYLKGTLVFDKKIESQEAESNDLSSNIISLDNTQDATDKISDSKVDEIAKDLFEKGSHKIRETEYSDYYEYESVQPVIEKTINGKKYQKRKVLYANVEKEYSKIFTGDALKNVLGKRFAEIDGDLYVSYGGATGWDVTNIKVSRISGNNNEIEYTVIYNDVDISDRITEEYSCKMTIKLVDGSYRISKINYCNIDKNS